MGKKVTKCISCDATDFKTYCKDLIQCTNCGLVVAEEIPTEKEIQKIYQQDYFFGMEYFDYEADRPALEHNFKRRIKRLNYMLPKGSKVIEIGCAYGYFLKMIEPRTKELIGFDVTADGVEYAKKHLGVQATTEDFLKYTVPAGSIDSVFMWDVAEHLTHPDAYFKKIAEILKPGGHVALTTGNVDAWLPRYRKEKWRMIHPPTHVYYFSPKTMELLLKKYGLDVVSVKHTSVSRNVGSVFNQILSNRKALNKTTAHINMAHKTAQALALDKVNLPLNTFDIMEVVARKV